MLCLSGSAFADVAHPPGGRLQIDVVRDRMTLSLTGYPQVYLHGEIDADAPRRFQSMLQSGLISPGSDVYLDSSSGDPEAGMALGRLFRAAGMATHLGKKRQPRHASVAAKTAVCLDACVDAYLGGLYRWMPTGTDRMGFTAAAPDGAPASSVKNAYLEQMGIDGKALAAAAAPSADGRAWLDARQMTASGLANNGKLALSVSAQLSAPTPTLELRQVARNGTHRLAIECRPGSTVVSAIDEVGAVRARQIAARRARSYFQLGEKPVLSQAHDGAVAEGDALVIRRSYPPAELGKLVSAWSVGAWVDGRTSAFRDGFSLPTHLVYKQLADFFQACWRAAPWPPGQTQAKSAGVARTGSGGAAADLPHGS